MKYIGKLFIIIIALFATSSCSKEFLERLPADSVSSDVLFSTLEGAKIHLEGIYALQNYYYGEGTRNFIFPEVMGDDVLVVSQNNYSRFVAAYNFSTTATSSRPEYMWYYSYRTISNCNLFLEQMQAMGDATADMEDLMGQAYALRATAYFTLARFFSEDAYTVNPDGAAVPISTAVEEVTVSSPIVSLKEIYALITSDLAEAERTVRENSYKGYIDMYGVAAIQARVYLTMGDWTNASKYANVVLNGSFKLMDEATYLSGFNATTSEVIWEQRFVDSDVNTFMSLPAFFYTNKDVIWGDTDGDGVITAEDIDVAGGGDRTDFTFGYNSLRVTRNLISKFEDTDFRKKLFARNLDSINNEPIAGAEYSTWFTNEGRLSSKISSANISALGTGDFPRIRLSEMYLIEAEAQANLGNSSAAQTALFAIQGRSDATVVKSSNTGSDLLDEIYLERRKELYFEGHRMHDLKRLDQDLDRSVVAANGYESDVWSDFSDLNSTYKENVLPRNSVSHMFCFPIPQAEIDANLDITEADQNSYWRK